jgi:hypothetical protein
LGSLALYYSEHEYRIVVEFFPYLAHPAGLLNTIRAGITIFTVAE